MGAHHPDVWIEQTQAVPTVTPAQQQPIRIQGADITRLAAATPVAADDRPHPARKWVFLALIALVLGGAAGGVLRWTGAWPDAKPAATQPVWQTRNGEIWWTTTNCPPGVVVPCLDNSVSLRELPEWAGGMVPSR